MKKWLIVGLMMVSFLSVFAQTKTDILESFKSMKGDMEWVLQNVTIETPEQLKIYEEIESINGMLKILIIKFAEHPDNDDEYFNSPKVIYLFNTLKQNHSNTIKNIEELFNIKVFQKEE